MAARGKEKLRDKNGKLKSVKIMPIVNISDLTQTDKSKSDILNKYTSKSQSQIKEGEINIYSNNVLVFSSEKEDLINKWLVVLDYFSSKI